MMPLSGVFLCACIAGANPRICAVDSDGAWHEYFVPAISAHRVITYENPWYLLLCNLVLLFWIGDGESTQQRGGAAVISVEHVSKRYQTRAGWRTVLSDVNFELQKRRKSGYSRPQWRGQIHACSSD